MRKQYRSAISHLLKAKGLSAKAGDSAGVALASSNLSTVYLQTGDMQAARASAEEALAQIAKASAVPGTREQALCNLGSALARQGHVQEAEQAFERAIEAALQSGQIRLLGQAWDSLGYERMKRGALEEAESSLLEAYRIQAPGKDPSLGATLSHLSELRQKQGDLPAAERLIESSIAAQGGGIPLWYLYSRRAGILSASNRRTAALRDYRRAVNLAQEWREEIAPSDSLRRRTADWLDELYGPYVEELLASAGPGGVPARDAAEAFGVIEEYRAAALRRTLAESPAWRKRLPDEYWEALSQLRASELELSETDSPKLRARINSLEGRMNEIEAWEYASSVGDNPYTPRENFSPVNTLSDIQHRLSQVQLLLSFHFGNQTSYVWAIGRDRAQVLRLGPSGPLRASALRFEEALEAGSENVERLGREVYAEFLGGVDARLLAKKEWVVAADDTTVRLPWVALREPGVRGEEQYVIEGHSVRLVTSAFALDPARKRPEQPFGTGEFLGVGDGVYNRADPRRPERTSHYPFGMAQAAAELPRLVGSGRELEACARSWRGKFQLLTGLRASRASFIEALAQKPAVIHIAAHVLGASDPGESVIQLGLGPGGAAEALTRYDVANLSVTGSTVVMSGCGSAASPAPPGTGLLGLARAWLIAGARSVVGSRWAAPDDSGGGLFESFYRNLRGGDRGMPVAGALRAAELEMLRSNSWRARPRYWASFIDVGKE
ncbi:MAG TPA: CHAT domain-containing tetratricopeptide repeat protein [Bryobacteraceae bacterium]|jgi:CHAT domain-containing protein/Tfp pilus assembly protein PilF|nr:CHAT domain-containing tetratricopeptide repeat protein [Bryobacteraceae bacterium]